MLDNLEKCKDPRRSRHLSHPEGQACQGLDRKVGNWKAFQPGFEDLRRYRLSVSLGTHVGDRARGEGRPIPLRNVKMRVPERFAARNWQGWAWTAEVWEANGRSRKPLDLTQNPTPMRAGYFLRRARPAHHGTWLKQSWRPAPLTGAEVSHSHLAQDIRLLSWGYCPSHLTPGSIGVGLWNVLLSCMCAVAHAWWLKSNLRVLFLFFPKSVLVMKLRSGLVASTLNCSAISQTNQVLLKSISHIMKFPFLKNALQ